MLYACENFVISVTYPYVSDSFACEFNFVYTKYASDSNVRYNGLYLEMELL